MSRPDSHDELTRGQRVARRVLKPLEQFLQIEAASGIVLFVAAAAALLWANSPWTASYDAFWHTPITLGVGELVFTQSLHFWINDGLMTIFFLVVGLEIRREMHDGVLSRPSAAMLPLIAALGGVAAPAIIYVAINPDPALRSGWAIPTATDIAFAVGVLTLLGKRVPPALRIMLLALAINDDIVAVLVIAFAYSSGVELSGLLLALAGVVGVIVLQKLGVASAMPYVAPGAVVWLGLLRAGVHPTLAGVVLGLLTPVSQSFRRESLLGTAARALEEIRDRLHRNPGDAHALAPSLRRLKVAHRELLTPVERVQLTLHPWVAYGIMPLFALANAGVHLSGVSLDEEALASVASGVFFGLLLGKPIGITLASYLAVRTGLSSLPPGVGWLAIMVMGCLGGIGFTMSIFITNLAFEQQALIESAKLAILTGSAAAAVGGLIFGRAVLRPAAGTTSPAHAEH